MNRNVALSDLASCGTRQVRAKLVRRFHRLCCVVLHRHTMPRTVSLFKSFQLIVTLAVTFESRWCAILAGRQAQRHHRLSAYIDLAQVSEKRKEAQSSDCATASTRRDASCRLTHAVRPKEVELVSNRPGGLGRARPRAAGQSRGQPSLLLSVCGDCLHHA